MDSEPAYLLLMYHTTSLDLLSINIVRMSPAFILLNLVLWDEGYTPRMFPLYIEPSLQ